MASEGKGVGGCLRTGCLGCAGVVVLCLGVGALLVTLGRGAVESQKITTQKVEEALPAATPAEAPTPAPRAEGPPFSDAPPLSPPSIPAQGATTPPRPGRMRIDLSHGQFEVEPAAPGEPLRVDAEYDESHYQLTTKLHDEQDGRWRYDIRFNSSGQSGFVAFLARLMGAREPRVTIRLPRDVPMDLDLRFSQGGGRIDLGGLWLTNTKVKFAQGGGDLEFSEPLREPTETLDIDASMGGGAFRGIGNASPRKLTVSSSMGGGDLDLRGRWLRDCDVSIVSRMGGLQVRVPADVATHGLPHDHTGPAGEPGSVPKLSFDYSASMGEIKFVD